MCQPSSPLQRVPIASSPWPPRAHNCFLPLFLQPNYTRSLLPLAGCEEEQRRRQTNTHIHTYTKSSHASLLTYLHCLRLNAIQQPEYISLVRSGLETHSHDATLAHMDWYIRISGHRQIDRDIEADIMREKHQTAKWGEISTPYNLFLKGGSKFSCHLKSNVLTSALWNYKKWGVIEFFVVFYTHVGVL